MDLKIPPSNRLKRLAGKLKEFYSIRIMINGVLYFVGGMDMLQILKLLTTIKPLSMRKLKNVHPGEVLMEEFLILLEISAYKLAKDVDIPQTRVSEILKCNRRITADTALRLSKYFGNSAKILAGLANGLRYRRGKKCEKQDF